VSKKPKKPHRPVSFHDRKGAWGDKQILEAGTMPPQLAPPAPPAPLSNRRGSREPFCLCLEHHPKLPAAKLGPDEQRLAWKLYWHHMAVLHPADKFEEGAGYYEKWWQIESKERADTSEREIIFRSWMDDLRIGQVMEVLCPACLERAKPLLTYDADDLPDTNPVPTSSDPDPVPRLPEASASHNWRQPLREDNGGGL